MSTTGGNTMGKPEHNATNRELSRWSLGVIASMLVTAGTIMTYFSGLWSIAVAAGQPKGDAAFVSQKQLQAVVQQVDVLDAGMAKKEDVVRLEKKVDALDDKMDELKNILIKQKGGK